MALSRLKPQSLPTHPATTTTTSTVQTEIVCGPRSHGKRRCWDLNPRLWLLEPVLETPSLTAQGLFAIPPLLPSPPSHSRVVLGVGGGLRKLTPSAL